MKPLLIFISVICFSVSEERLDLNWNEAKLKWSDFKGIAPERSEVDATSSVKTLLTWKGSGSKIIFEITTVFIKEKSWVVQENATIDLLNHEQRHFDLKEYSTRCLREKILNHKFSSRNDIQKEIDFIVSEVKKEGDFLQEQYDKISDLSKNKEGQLLWDMKIDSLLNSKRDFSESHLELEIRHSQNPTEE